MRVPACNCDRPGKIRDGSVWCEGCGVEWTGVPVEAVSVADIPEDAQEAMRAMGLVPLGRLDAT